MLYIMLLSLWGMCSVYSNSNRRVQEHVKTFYSNEWECKNFFTEINPAEIHLKTNILYIHSI